jgi:pilus assembly protein CpaE
MKAPDLSALKKAESAVPDTAKALLPVKGTPKGDTSPSGSAPEPKDGGPPQLLAARAGIHDQRDGLRLKPREAPRTGPLDVSSLSLRVEDIELLSVDSCIEELGVAPELPTTVPSQMIVFFGPKGGMGTTTLAVNVAGTLSRLGHPTVLVDMDLQLGCVPIALNMRPERTLASLVVEAERLGEGPLETPLDVHPSGVSVVAQTRIEELGDITTERLPRFFEALGHQHPFLIVDGLRDFDDHAVATMDLAHLVVLVVTQDVPAVRAAARSLRLFRRLGYPPERIQLAINRYSPKGPISLENISGALGCPVSFTVGNNFPLIEQALNQGHMVSDLDSSGSVGRDLRNLARSIAGLPAEPRPGGFLARVFGRG